MSTDDTRPVHDDPADTVVDDDTRPLADDLGLREEPDRRAAARPADHARTADPYATPVTYRRGPAPFAVFLGLVGLVVAGGIFVEEIADVSVPWGDLGPWAVVAGGLVVVLVGVLGLRANRSED